MSGERNEIDELFKDGLQDLKLIPPADVWENIEKQLDKKRRGGFFISWTAWAAGIALIIGIGSFYFLSQNHKSHEELALNQTLSKREKKNNHTTKENSITQQDIEKSQTQQYSLNQVSKNNQGNPQNTSDMPNSQKISRFESTTGDKSASHQPNVLANETQLPEKLPNTEAPSTINGGNDSPLLASAHDESKITTIHPIKSVISSKEAEKPVIPNNLYSSPATSDYLNFLASSDFVNPEQKKQNPWSIEGQVAPQYSYRTISGSSGGSSSADYNSQETGLMAYAGGFKVSYETNNRLSFQMGVVYSVMGQTLNDVYSVSGGFASNNLVTRNTGADGYMASNSLGQITNHPSTSNLMYAKSVAADALSAGNLANPANTMNNLVGTNKAEVQLIQQQRYIEIPFLARYTLIDRKIGLHLVGGLSTNLLVGNDVFAKSNHSTENIGETSDLKPVNYNGNIGFGINYKIWTHTSFLLEPTFKYYLNSISSQSSISYHPYSFGVFTGIRYKF